MTIKATYQALQTVANAALPGFTFYGMYKDQYNTVKDIKDGVVIVEPPRQWPINHRNTCESYFDAKVWIGLRQPIKPATGGVFEYPPFNEIDIRDTLHIAANTFVNAINGYSTLRVIGDFNGQDDLITLMDAPEGGSTNWQAWGYFTIKVVSYGSSGSYTPVVFAQGLTCLTQYTIQNGDSLPAGLTPDVLYIDTGVIVADLETEGLGITVPPGYWFREISVLSGINLAFLTVYDTNDDVVTIAGNVRAGVATIAVKFPLGESLFYEFENQVSLIKVEGNASPGFRAILKFERARQ